MSTQIIVSSSDEKVHIRYSSRHGNYDLLAGESQDFRMSLSEQELRELQVLIEEILQHKNKRDY